MATITAVQLRQRVAEELKVYSPDQELSADVASRIDTSIADTRAWLQEKRLCWWGADAIPQAASIPLTWIVAAMACTKFGKAGQGYEAGEDRGRRELASLRPSADIATLAPDYF
jgi:hypothetical protein